MAKDWREVKKEIEAEIDKIWLNEPEEVKKSRLGIFPSGAGVYGTYLGNLVFLNGDIAAVGYSFAEEPMLKSLSNPSFTLEQCKQLFHWFTADTCELLGGTYGEKCPAPWMNMGTLCRLYKDAVGCYDTIKTKEELKELLDSWYIYLDRLYRWIFFMFPWYVGTMFPKKELKDVEELAKLSGLRIAR